MMNIDTYVEKFAVAVVMKHHKWTALASPRKY